MIAEIVAVSLTFTLAFAYLVVAVARLLFGDAPNWPRWYFWAKSPSPGRRRLGARDFAEIALGIGLIVAIEWTMVSRLDWNIRVGNPIGVIAFSVHFIAAAAVLASLINGYSKAKRNRRGTLATPVDPRE